MILNYTGRKGIISSELLQNGTLKWREAGQTLKIVGPSFDCNGCKWVPVVFDNDKFLPDLVILDAIVLQ